MALYFAFEAKDFMHNQVNTEMIFLILQLSLIVSYACGAYVSEYFRPLAFAALITLFVADRRTAVFINFVFCIMVFLFDSFVTSSFDIGNYPSLIMGFSAGLLATFCMDTVHSRLKLFARSLIVSIPALLSVGMNIIEHGSASFDIGVALACAASSGPLSAIIFSVLLPIFETLFKKVSYFKYSELTDHKAPVIRKLIKYAPGTFNHAVVVSNIAEACAAAIEEDSLLARTCAYYHDIGQLRRPEFFTENQSETGNPHDDLTPELSANIIKSHAMDGAALAEKHRLPKEIVDVCREHHGTLPIAYFYDKAKKFTDGEVDISQFRYPGPKPKSKIAAIIMIADACEAAARALKDRSRENVTKKVREIVNERMSLGQFDDCEITLKELNIIIHTVVNNLSGVYHSRIEYPKVSFDGIE
jgi:putative nucleotidyltransferase with HDIG domain